MAIYEGPFASGMRGKLGNVVGAKTVGGRTAIRAYKEHIKNPNTTRQQTSRLRMKTASGISAALSNAIKTGYAQASKGMKMYARNVFVSALVKNDADTPLHIVDGAPVVTYGELKVSKRAGISMVPDCGAPSSAEPLMVSVNLNPVTVTDVLPEGKLGVAVVVYAPGLGASVLKMVEAPSTSALALDIAMPGGFSGETVHVYAFHKWIPASGNDIATVTEPWKYPSETSDTAYAGTTTVS